MPENQETSADYKVEISFHYVRYSENCKSVDFSADPAYPSKEDIYIYIPSYQEFDSLYPWAEGRRDEIIDRIAMYIEERSRKHWQQSAGFQFIYPDAEGNPVRRIKAHKSYFTRAAYILHNIGEVFGLAPWLGHIAMTILAMILLSQVIRLKTAIDEYGDYNPRLRPLGWHPALSELWLHVAYQAVFCLLLSAALVTIATGRRKKGFIFFILYLILVSVI